MLIKEKKMSKKELKFSLEDSKNYGNKYDNLFALNFYSSMNSEQDLCGINEIPNKDEQEEIKNYLRKLIYGDVLDNIHQYLLDNYPNALDRKWYMITIIPVIFGIMRYGQIIFEMQEGERPERLIATDIPLLMSVLIWGLLIVSIIYVL
jgi:hypothetical protein